MCAAESIPPPLNKCGNCTLINPETPPEIYSLKDTVPCALGGRHGYASWWKAGLEKIGEPRYFKVHRYPKQEPG